MHPPPLPKSRERVKNFVTCRLYWRYKIPFCSEIVKIFIASLEY